ncbi:helix-turn-helix domain-containing protein [Pectinatus frisingensis]|uniref:helix-turn-helix domain-containing protein n=1 Tax=Pectinatus frisingensis TaxID=865 RepID=UPI003D809074
MEILDLDLIKERRKKNGLTLKQMADRLGFSNASVYYKYESGIYAFKAETLPILAMILKCDINNFFKKNYSKTEINRDQKSA